MTSKPLIRIDGEVDRPLELGFAELEVIDPAGQVVDVSRIAPSRRGDAVTLAALLELAGVKPTAKYLGLHSSTDDFHASIPLEPVRDQALLIYRLDAAPLDVKAGGPLRFYIPNHAACHTDEIDECANVKFVDRIELTSSKGFDNRPVDEDEHARLHRQQ